ncbi:unnamed protein product [Rhizoctonia solani]|uniref:Uncharacterized protein n=1 Tax=Rhizoctonia solani TaxID=456999 RepID=A0A8H3DVD2_9AGAM|nr:unnamed protein product [Rhizoctonia solani]
MPAQIVPGGQLAPGHPIKYDQPHQATTILDEFYGLAQMAKTSARFISTLLACPESLPSTDLTEANPDLAQFIAFAPHRSCLPLCVHQDALHLVWHVKCLNPDFNPKHAHGTYLTALMLAAKQSTYLRGVSAPREREEDVPHPQCERLESKFLVAPMDLVKLAWTIEAEYGELNAGAPPSYPEAGLGGMFSASVASSLLYLSTYSSECSLRLNSPWSGWDEATPCGSTVSTPSSSTHICYSSLISPFILA